LTAIPGPGPVRCSRCNGSGDIAIIAEDSTTWENRDRPPLLQCCPDCAGTGMLREAESDLEQRRRAR